MAGHWNHVVGVMDAAKHQAIYYNGSLAGSRTATGFFSGNYNWDIGDEVATGGMRFHGTIDEVRVYNRALSASEVLGLYNAGQATIRK
jgi:hypothetical protein